jgi:hypothetical protein
LSERQPVSGLALLLTVLTIRMELGIFPLDRPAGFAGVDAVVADGHGPWSQV